MENNARAYQQVISIQILKLRNLCFRQVALAFRLLHNKIDYGLQSGIHMVHLFDFICAVRDNLQLLNPTWAHSTNSNKSISPGDEFSLDKGCQKQVKI